MALETDLQAMARHLVDKLEAAKASILVGADQAFAVCDYGEPRVITQWPYCSVQPIEKRRVLNHTKKFDIEFSIHVVIYHGQVAQTLDIQEATHKRIEAVENWLTSGATRPFKWNFTDADSANDKVIFGFPEVIDHPVVVAPEDELWSASRLQLIAKSQEVF